MYNVRNNVTLIGRVSQETVVFGNSDGSKKAIGKIAVQDNYKTGDKYESEFLEYEMFIGKDKTSWIEKVPVGDMVAVEGHLTRKPYEKDGKTIYELKVIADKVTPLSRAAGNKAGQELAEAEAEA